MTIMQQQSNIDGFGYTGREAVFLITAALHSGYFVMRQIAPKGGAGGGTFQPQGTEVWSCAGNQMRQ